MWLGENVLVARVSTTRETAFTAEHAEDAEVFEISPWRVLGD